MPQDPDQQLALFRQAVGALGGKLPAARALGISERSVRYLCAGEHTIHDGILEDTARALLRHADACRELERRLSPAFDANRTAAQIAGTANKGRWPRDRGEFGQREPLDFTGQTFKPARSAGSPSSSAKRDRATK